MPFQDTLSDDPHTMLSLLPNPQTPNPPKHNSSGSSTRQDSSKQHLCWDHSCKGRAFASKSNLERHKKERGASGATGQAMCPLCGAVFTRKSARDTHLARQSCNRIRRYSNGRCRPSRLAMLENPALAASGGVQHAPLWFAAAGSGVDDSEPP